MLAAAACLQRAAMCKGTGSARLTTAHADSCLSPCGGWQQLSRRMLLGACRDKRWSIDCVVPVPDGSRPAAIQISAELGLPYREGLVKNRYVGRTFIMPDQR